jgi:hypothetical protein
MPTGELQNVFKQKGIAWQELQPTANQELIL